jgi:hypothetical protein
MAKAATPSNIANWPRDGLTLEPAIERAIRPLATLYAVTAGWRDVLPEYRARQYAQIERRELPPYTEQHLSARIAFQREEQATFPPFLKMLATGELVAAVRPWDAIGVRLQPLRPDEASQLQIKVDYSANSLWLYGPNNKRIYGVFWSKDAAPTIAFPVTIVPPTKVEDGLANAGPDPFRTGVAGRPTAADLIKVEAERRIREHEVEPKRGGLTKFSQELATWWKEERYKYDKPGPSMSTSGIRNCGVRGLWNRSLSGTRN